jgi:1-acyl-sn-glycerol-3-phosphate acyltransferase
MDQPSGPFGYRLAKSWLGRPLRLAFEIEIQGAASIPTGPVILAANHRSFMDSLFLASVVDRPISFLAKAEYFDRRATAWMFRSTGQIPLRRGSPAGARRALEEAGEVLAAGGVVGVYPEGTRSRDGRLQRGHLGPARLALSTGAPIVPVGLMGTEHVQAPGQRLPRLGRRVTVRFGLPRWPDPIESGDPGVSPSLRDFTELVMGDIASLCGQHEGERFATVGG